ncbi:hypothetical protein AA313_de0204840 [Arthrobotrys entomopaga]|nr:hypothetical protein AA313_de0204840 [Arthrobotrys entomopaga]
MFITRPSGPVGGHYFEEGVFNLGGHRHPAEYDGDVASPVDIRQPPPQPHLISPKKGTDKGSPQTAETLVAIQCPANRIYSFHSMDSCAAAIEIPKPSEQEKTWATNPDGRPVTSGQFLTTDNSAPGQVFHITNPRFVPGQPLKVNGTEQGATLLRPAFCHTPVDMSNMFYQCSNANCGKRIAAELTRGCAKCGSLSTTRYCSESCQWGDRHHWKVCGRATLVRGNLLPRHDAQRVISLKQTYVPPNGDAWRQQVSHATCPGTYSLFMRVDDGLGLPYGYAYQVGFAPGWEANAFAFLTRLAVDMGHISAIKLLFRWIKRQIKRKAPAAWSDKTFGSFVGAVADQLFAEFGPAWAYGELFGGVDDITTGGFLDHQTMQLMMRQGWRVVAQDFPGFAHCQVPILPPPTTPVPPPFFAGIRGFGLNPFAPGGQLHPLPRRLAEAFKQQGAPMLARPHPNAIKPCDG